eukprot:TRINITY_DN715_c0_g1_i1.p1 TRINITY_DN715_c0_g1~~TRINITY_DN715_c0_g1_i1.p1  ORF type:complete len:233 (-),score=54.31 TRINITY_DN715_c0_g1_i1:244-942(-)
MDELQVQAQLTQMQNFILQEAEDKAAEIRAKANEEFSIEKAKLIQAEKLKIMKEYERKEKLIETQKKTAYSNELNQSRIKILKARDENLQKIVAEAQSRLADFSRSPEYKNTLQRLIAQGLLRLREPKVQVVFRKEDQALVQSVLAEATREYEEKSGLKSEVTLHPSLNLPPGPVAGQKGPSCAGGVILSSLEGKIICKNTLDARLELAFEQRLPEIRIALYGRSKTRTHFT